jgi:EAL domain-containing protein (putative c-di-GMP-specific phosphodiesterase class I)
LALYPKAGKDPETLVKHADQALYRAKDSQKNCFKFFTTELQEKISRRFSIENSLRIAVETDEIELVYQPQVHLATNKLAGFEVLVRWNNKEMGMISPAEFIPIAEETGLIDQLGEKILERSLQQFSLWQKKFPWLVEDQVKLSINLSPVQLADKTIAEKIISLIQRNSIKPEQVVLELTETALMQNSDRAKVCLEDLSNMGIAIALDDFGTGYSSITYLMDFPVSYLKIDVDFIKKIFFDDHYAKIVKGVIFLAKEIGLFVVAEGVESKEAFNFLIENKCNVAQGYFCGKPYYTNEAEEYLKGLTK